ncbi:MAG: hypothetical protein A4E58_02652 [Syntrophorhabdus sp. PtaB.Bin006]|nr:MAG: hypothetical protein A4E58_02652 [Syntrophorhabdus sp. PtaB.Bin006]
MHPSILRNTLLSPSSIEKISSTPIGDNILPALTELLANFQDIKKFASEIHTEIHLVKPMLKLLGYTYESKPKFFEDNVKDPDVALFASEDDRVNSSPLWGTPEYYGNTQGILMLKRYGRNLHEGITGFYLEFENRIPMYQLMYLLQKASTPWGILTNGRYWMLIKKPGHFEEKLIEIDLEQPLLSGEEEPGRLFYNIFSLNGLKDAIPNALEEEREALITLLMDKKKSIVKATTALKKKVDIYPQLRRSYKSFFPNDNLTVTDSYLKDRGVQIENVHNPRPAVVNEYNASDICSYLFTRNTASIAFDLEQIIARKNRPYTKEDLLSLRILDMTPGLGNVTIQLLEGMAYLSFLQPYREKNTFVSEWEDEASLKKYILNRMLYGVERSHICYDALQNSLTKRFGTEGRHYRLGNPLVGISLKNIENMFDVTKQMSLFGKTPKELIADFREMYRVYFSLSRKIREDVKIREEIEIKLTVYRERMKDVMDAVTATFFAKDIESKKIQDMVFSMEADEAHWGTFRDKDWLIEAKEIAARNGFFHMELEFPVLLNNGFDLIFAQPAMNYNWEDAIPAGEAAKAYIKQGMTFLKQDGRLVLLLDGDNENLLLQLQKSKKFDVRPGRGFLVLFKKTAP